uniref:Uncharacterized protein n=1 Tax=Pyramimonas orientalis virus TaxID=455367 RepID=A0A7M3UP23_POV01|nr:hypothetical protein HWQ62_00342 [Pyramimonas orientalis virus]
MDIQNVVNKLKTFEYIAIAGSLFFVILVSLMIYNMVKIHNVNKDAEEEQKKQLLSIALNKHELNMLKRYINEEVDENEQQIRKNTGKANANINNIVKNRNELNRTIDLISKNKQDIVDVNTELIANESKFANYQNAYNSYVTSQSNMLKTIKENQAKIQTNIGEFEYKDFYVLKDAVNSNNTKIQVLTTNTGSLRTDVNNNTKELDGIATNVGSLRNDVDGNIGAIGVMEENLESINSSFITKSNVATEINTFYTYSILPKFTLVDENVNKFKDDFKDEFNTYKTNVVGPKFLEMDTLSNNFATFSNDVVGPKFLEMDTLSNNFATFSNDVVGHKFLEMDTLSANFATMNTNFATFSNDVVGPKFLEMDTLSNNFVTMNTNFVTFSNDVVGPKFLEMDTLSNNFVTMNTNFATFSNDVVGPKFLEMDTLSNNFNEFVYNSVNEEYN